MPQTTNPEESLLADLNSIEALDFVEFLRHINSEPEIKDDAVGIYAEINEMHKAVTATKTKFSLEEFTNNFWKIIASPELSAIYQPQDPPNASDDEKKELQIFRDEQKTRLQKFLDHITTRYTAEGENDESVNNFFGNVYELFLRTPNLEEGMLIAQFPPAIEDLACLGGIGSRMSMIRPPSSALGNKLREGDLKTRMGFYDELKSTVYLGNQVHLVPLIQLELSLISPEQAHKTDVLYFFPSTEINLNTFAEQLAAYPLLLQEYVRDSVADDLNKSKHEENLHDKVMNFVAAKLEKDSELSAETKSRIVKFFSGETVEYQPEIYSKIDALREEMRQKLFPFIYPDQDFSFIENISREPESPLQASRTMSLAPSSSASRTASTNELKSRVASRVASRAISGATTAGKSSSLASVAEEQFYLQVNYSTLAELDFSQRLAILEQDIAELRRTVLKEKIARLVNEKLTKSNFSPDDKETILKLFDQNGLNSFPANAPKINGLEEFREEVVRSFSENKSRRSTGFDDSGIDSSHSDHNNSAHNLSSGSESELTADRPQSGIEEDKADQEQFVSIAFTDDSESPANLTTQEVEAEEYNAAEFYTADYVNTAEEKLRNYRTNREDAIQALNIVYALSLSGKGSALFHVFHQRIYDAVKALPADQVGIYARLQSKYLKKREDFMAYLKQHEPDLAKAMSQGKELLPEDITDFVKHGLFIIANSSLETIDELVNSIDETGWRYALLPLTSPSSFGQGFSLYEFNDLCASLEFRPNFTKIFNRIYYLNSHSENPNSANPDYNPPHITAEFLNGCLLSALSRTISPNFDSISNFIAEVFIPRNPEEHTKLETAFLRAFYVGDTETIINFLSKGFCSHDLEVEDSPNLKVLISAMELAIEAEFLDVLEAVIAAQLGAVEAIDAYVKTGKVITNLNSEQQTPLHIAVLNGLVPAVKVLLQRKESIKAENKDGVTALGYAATINEEGPDGEKTYQIAELILQNSIIVPATDTSRAVIDPAVIDHANKNLQTPLHIAALSNNLNMVRLLLDNGARTDLKDREGNTALDNARHQLRKTEQKHGADSLQHSKLAEIIQIIETTQRQSNSPDPSNANPEARRLSPPPLQQGAGVPKV